MFSHPKMKQIQKTKSNLHGSKKRNAIRVNPRGLIYRRYLLQ